MRAHGNEGRLGRRFAIVIGLAAAGVMALGAQTTAAAPEVVGAQTAAAAPEVVKYRTRLLITTERGFLHHGRLLSDRDRNPGYDPAHAVRKCMEGRRVTVFKQRPGADRKLGTRRSRLGRGHGIWGTRFVKAAARAQVYAKVRREVHDEFVCRGDRSGTI
jgi:hypothetical protein